MMTRRTEVSELKRAASRVGGVLVPWSAGYYEGFHVEAPLGKRWVDGGVMALRVEWAQGDRGYKADAIQDAIDRVECGLRDATPEELADE